jgi:hypothetical protein
MAKEKKINVILAKIPKESGIVLSNQQDRLRRSKLKSLRIIMLKIGIQKPMNSK